MADDEFNIADRLRVSAAKVPRQRAVVFPETRDAAGRVAWTHVTFEQLNAEVDAVARGLIGLGVRPGHRIVLMVRPSIEFIALTFGIMRSGACCTLIDPGMGTRSVLRCLNTVNPDGFVAITPVHVVRRLMPWRFRSARFNVVVGPRTRRLGCESYRQLVNAGRKSCISMPATTASDSAAIIFTSGSTGPPKGVHYEHGMFSAQVDLIRDRYQIQPGEVDLPGFPLFSLFNLAMQVTSVIPDMDPTRPAAVNPECIVEAIESQNVTQAYGSPALWNRVGRYCEERKITLTGLRRILSAGAPVPNHVLQRMTNALNSSAFFYALRCHGMPAGVIDLSTRGSYRNRRTDRNRKGHLRRTRLRRYARTHYRDQFGCPAGDSGYGQPCRWSDRRNYCQWPGGNAGVFPSSGGDGTGEDS
ncbi:MAG: AMP-binding protein [Planctomycetaceae bacterium]